MRIKILIACAVVLAGIGCTRNGELTQNQAIRDPAKIIIQKSSVPFFIVVPDNEQALAAEARKLNQLVRIASAGNPNSTHVTVKTAGKLPLPFKKAIDNAGIPPDNLHLLTVYEKPGNQINMTVDHYRAVSDNCLAGDLQASPYNNLDTLTDLGCSNTGNLVSGVSDARDLVGHRKAVLLHNDLDVSQLAISFLSGFAHPETGNIPHNLSTAVDAGAKPSADPDADAKITK